MGGGGHRDIKQDGEGTKVGRPPKLGEQRQQREVKGLLKKAGTKHNGQVPGHGDVGQTG